MQQNTPAKKDYLGSFPGKSISVHKFFCEMWLKIVYNEEDITNWHNESDNISVFIDHGKIAPIKDEIKSFRLSPIFPLCKEHKLDSINGKTIYFFNFSNPYRILGIIDKKGSDYLRKCVYYSLGLSSLIIISENNTALDEFRQLIKAKEKSSEQWDIRSGKIQNVNLVLPQLTIGTDNEVSDIVDYEVLPITDRALIDEFRISIKLLLIKLNHHMPTESAKIKKLVDEVNSLIVELVYLQSFSGTAPATLNEYTIEDLKDKKISQLIRHQNLDRVIQINSALSYISTQAFSGAIPILERRSLIRRTSLLGVGSAILALNNVARFIENAFSLVPFEEIITNIMPLTKALNGMGDLPVYDSSEWHKEGIDKFVLGEFNEVSYHKLPYFSGRLGFRETEYSISAAIQSITSGAGLEWSLMTLTHEMLHGHVRNVIDSIFFGLDKQKSDVLKELFYESFSKKLCLEPNDEHLIDSVRNIILLYCCSTITTGSLTKEIPYEGNIQIKMPSQTELWDIFSQEHRNISEIFVHVLDLHYFYASRLSIYIPLIWCSWLSVPHINGDIRQYILRSFLSIASSISGNPYQRFLVSVSRFKEILNDHVENKLNNPTIHNVLQILEDNDLLHSIYFPPFQSSLIIVDLAKNVFYSPKIRSAMYNDEFVMFENNEVKDNGFEQNFTYGLPEGFNDEIIKSPLAYLLDKMINELSSMNTEDDLEMRTALVFLALNSNE